MAGISAPRSPVNSRYAIGLATHADDAELRRLLRENPTEGNPRITFEREPDFFAACSLMGTQHQTVIARARDSNQLIGMGTRSVRTMYLAGQARRGGYLSELRVAHDHRGRCGLVSRGYALFRQLHADGAAPCYLTSISSDNTQARRFLEAGLPGMPTYTRLGTYHTFAITTRRVGGRADAGCARGSAAFREEIAACLHRNYRRYAWAPHWRPNELGSAEHTPGLDLDDFLILRDGSGVSACMALWDQRRFRQIVVRGYNRRLARWRWLVNLCAPITGQPRLPSCGMPWTYAYVSPMAIDDDDPEQFLRLLRATAQRAGRKRYEYVILGLAATHPLLNSARKLKTYREYTNELYMVTWDPPPPELGSVCDAIPPSRGGAAVIVEFTQVPAVQPRDRDDMFALMDQHFESMVRHRFEEDLAHKDWVMMVKDAGQLVGFTTVRLIDTRISSRDATAVYSGDTLVSPAHRMGAAFARGWFVAMRHVQQSRPERPLYWFLLSSGFRTYRFMPVYWKEFYPRHDCPTPASWQADIDHLARMEFRDTYDATLGIVRLAHPQVLRRDVREIPAGRTKDSNIAFFERRNSGHLQGDELVCLTRIAKDNLTPTGMRMWDPHGLSFAVVKNEPAMSDR